LDLGCEDIFPSASIGSSGSRVGVTACSGAAVAAVAALTQ